jgi:Fe-S-cluster-containing dehydrogenase component
MENNLRRDLFYRWVVDTQLRSIPATGADLRFVSMGCFHCANPACIPACPVPNAITKDSTTGAVIIDQTLCNGCKRCAGACPYGAPQFNENTRKMEKCHFCKQRLDAGLKPACVMSCVGRALNYGPDTSVTPGGTAPTGFASTTMTNPQILFA